MARSRCLWRVATGPVFAAALAVLVWLGCSEGPSGPGPEEQGVALQGLQERLGTAIAVQERHTDRLLALPGVVGTAAGLTPQGQPAVKIYTRAPGVAGLPRSLDGLPVIVEATGEFFAIPARAAPAGAALAARIDPTDRFPRPVPIGVSTGNIGECSAGTIGARVKSGGTVYALSNNHVYALENDAPIGSKVLQPGRFDTNCATSNADVIGTLSAFQSIVFSTSAKNTIDAAIAGSTTANLGRSTPANGYGTPKAATVSAAVNQAVQKYGRTTSLTKGSISGVNATVKVGYSSGTARFVNQIIVSSRRPFIKAGDSGSLLVTDPGRNPVGLLFAGTQDGKTAIANRINLVLNRFGVTIDGL